MSSAPTREERSERRPQQLSSLATMLAAPIVVLLGAGVLVHGISAGVRHRFFHNLIDRPDGPMRFRFILQPLMSAMAAVRDGRADIMAGRSPFFATILGKPEESAARLREALNATARIVLLGIGIDVLYQTFVLKTFYPAEAAVIAVVLTFLPYVVIQGLVSRHRSFGRLRPRHLRRRGSAGMPRWPANYVRLTWPLGVRCRHASGGWIAACAILSRSLACGLLSPDEIPPEPSGSQKRWFAVLPF